MTRKTSRKCEINVRDVWKTGKSGKSALLSQKGRRGDAASRLMMRRNHGNVDKGSKKEVKVLISLGKGRNEKSGEISGGQ